MAYDKLDSIISFVRKGTPDSPYNEQNETLIVDNSAKVQLIEYPHEYFRVLVTGDNKEWYETEKDIPAENEFKVDYQHKLVTFNQVNIGKQLAFKYSGVGGALISAHNIYTERDGLEVKETLQSLTDTTTEARNETIETNTNVQNAEVVRVESENERIGAEDSRIQNETTRQNSETARETNEDTRVNQETTRQNQHTNRMSEADSAISNANEKATFAQTQGDYAKAQADDARQQADLVWDMLDYEQVAASGLKLGKARLVWNLNTNSLDFVIDE